MSPRTHFVYRCFDREGRLLYVGMTRKPEQRHSWHRSGSRWFKDMDSCRMFGPLTVEAAADLERVLIFCCKPIHNKARFWPHPAAVQRWRAEVERAKAGVAA